MDWKAFVAPWWILSFGMLVDEAWFHVRRGLPRWERVGHPVDTAAVLACFLVAVFEPPTLRWRRLFWAAAALSMLLVVKDERVHLERCAPGEARLHALLFMLHPLALLSIYGCWLSLPSGPFILRNALEFQTGLVLSFFLWQIVYWNFLCGPARE